MSDNSEYRNVHGCNGGQIKHKEPDYVIALRAQLAEAQKEIERLELSAICVYCGKITISKSIEEKLSDIINHMAVCEKHPVPILLERARKVESENAALRAEIAIYKGSLQILADLRARLKQPVFLEVKTCETCSFGDIDKHNAPCRWCGGSSHWQAIKAACEDKHE